VDNLLTIIVLRGYVCNECHNCEDMEEITFCELVSKHNGIAICAIS
jgi:hypothetical protein